MRWAFLYARVQSYQFSLSLLLKLYTIFIVPKSVMYRIFYGILLYDNYT